MFRAWRCLFLAERVIMNMTPTIRTKGRRVTRLTVWTFLRAARVRTTGLGFGVWVPIRRKGVGGV
jgi:hypothetical protein